MEVKKITWFPRLDAVMEAALGDDLEFIKNEIKTGVCELWEVVGKGYLITRIEPDQSKQPYELVFVAAVGKNMQAAIPYFQELARPLGVQKMRIHSKRPGMGRYLKSFGFEQAEVVYSASL